MEKRAIAILGLGTMGSGMARCLLKAGFPVTVYNGTADKAAALAKEGARVAATPSEAAAGASIVLSMLAEDDASRSVWLGENGALQSVTANTVLIESSTVTVNWIRELAAVAEKSECQLLDAPVTGSKSQANAGELIFLVGGSAEVLEIARPPLQAMSRSIVHLGPTGSGARMKLINNFLCGVQAASFAEALTLIEKSGLDREKALSVLLNGAPGSPLIKTMAARMTSQDGAVNFLLRLMAKDLSYAQREAEENSLTLKTAAGARELFQAAIDAGFGDCDMASVVEPLRARPQ